MILRANLTLALVLLFNLVFAQYMAIKDSIVKYSALAKGTVGVSVIELQGKNSVSIDGNRHFPMQSVMKFPLAITILHMIDEGKLGLDQKVHLTKNDLSIPYASPLHDKYPEGNADVTIAQLLSFTVSQSDNNGCDKLFAIAGGTSVVNDHMHSLGITDMAIVATEKEMGAAWPVQYTNWCTPNAMGKLLTLFYNGKTLSQKSTAYLLELLTKTVNAPKRIKGLLPASAVVGHKPGTSGTNSEGVAAATNDVGIVTRPNGRSFAITIFVCDAKADLPVRERCIAEITRAVWNMPN